MTGFVGPHSYTALSRQQRTPRLEELDGQDRGALPGAKIEEPVKAKGARSQAAGIRRAKIEEPAAAKIEEPPLLITTVGHSLALEDLTQ